MTTEELGRRAVELLGDGCEATLSGGGRWARATVDVPPERWVDAVRTVRDRLGCGFFDWLSAVDEQGAPAGPDGPLDGFRIVAHLWSVPARHGLLLRTLLPRESPSLRSIVDVFPGAAWHERETHEMFGVDFPGHPHLAPLLLPPEFEGHPLRKEFVLAARVAKAWPGAKEPGEEHAKRAPMRPPGVPAPGDWGPA
jgi:NADH-quinone oxidoreductase subunit C